MKEACMKKLKNLEYISGVPVSGSVILDKDIKESVKKDYAIKNLNETQ